MTEKARSCIKSLDRNIWRFSISADQIRLYNVYILPILLYGADKWSMTVASSRCLDAFDQWCLRRMVHIPYAAPVTTHHRGGGAWGRSASSRLGCRKGAASSVRTSCDIRPVARPLAHPSDSHRSSSGGLAAPGGSARADVAPYNRARPSSPLPWSQHSVDVCAGSFKVA